MERRRDVGEGHTTYVGRRCKEHLGQPDFLIFAQMEIGDTQRANFRQAMPQHEERWNRVEGGMAANPRRQQLVGDWWQKYRQLPLRREEP